MGTTSQEVWEEPDPIKVIALEQAVKANPGNSDQTILTTARRFESYLKEKDPEPEPTYVNP